MEGLQKRQRSTREQSCSRDCLLLSDGLSFHSVNSFCKIIWGDTDATCLLFMQRCCRTQRNLQFGISCFVFGPTLPFKRQCCNRGLNETASLGGLELTTSNTAGIQAHFCSSCLVKDGDTSYLDPIEWLWIGSAAWSNEVWLHACKTTAEEAESGKISEREAIVSGLCSALDQTVPLLRDCFRLQRHWFSSGLPWLCWS